MYFGYRAVLALGLLVVSLSYAFAEDVLPAAQETETIHVTLLPVQEGFSVQTPNRAGNTVTFKKEPAYAGKMIRRGFVSTNEQRTEGVGYAWDESDRKLYIDFNGNLDLTDDPDSVYTGTPIQAGLGYEVRGVRLQRKIGEVNVPCIADFEFTPEGKWGLGTTQTFKSGWVGEFDINGQRWRLGIGDDFGTRMRFDTEEYSKALFLKRADAGRFLESENLHDAPSLFLTPAFFAGVMGKFAFTLAEQPVPGSDEKRVVIEATIKIARPETFPVRLNGKFIDSIILTQLGTEPCLAIIQQPDGELRLPAGTYTIKNMVVGKDPAFVLNRFSQTYNLSVGSGQEAILNLGGPLQTQIDILRQGSVLRFSGQIGGIGKETYQKQDAAGGTGERPKAPQVAVYKGDKRILLAQLEYG